jgi:hypothetical protein
MCCPAPMIAGCLPTCNGTCGMLPDACHRHFSGALSDQLSELSVVRERCTRHTAQQQGRGGCGLSILAPPPGFLLHAPAYPSFRMPSLFTSVCLGPAPVGEHPCLPLLSTRAAPHSGATQDPRRGPDEHHRSPAREQNYASWKRAICHRPHSPHTYALRPPCVPSPRCGPRRRASREATPSRDQRRSRHESSTCRGHGRHRQRPPAQGWDTL